MTEADIVLAPLPQADGRVKNRPALVLRAMPPHGDLPVCGLSTQLHHETPGFDEVLHATVGSISPERHQRMVQRLADYLVSDRLPS